MFGGKETELNIIGLGVTFFLKQSRLIRRHNPKHLLVRMSSLFFLHGTSCYRDPFSFLLFTWSFLELIEKEVLKVRSDNFCRLISRCIFVVRCNYLSILTPNYKYYHKLNIILNETILH